jgi:electron transfer flavoprotein alpha subunit
MADTITIENCGVWVFAEQLEGKLNSVTLELISEAKKLGSKLNVPVSAILLGDSIKSIIPILFEYGADKVYVIMTLYIIFIEQRPIKKPSAI